MTKDKSCEGCNSYTYIKEPELTVNRCVLLYFQPKSQEFHYIFIQRFCPCKKCLVKVTCKDPKAHLNVFRYIKEARKDCKLFFKAIKDFEQYVDDNQLRKTKIKIKRKKC